MKKFVAGMLCGASVGALSALAAAVIVGLRARMIDPLEEAELTDHH